MQTSETSYRPRSIVMTGATSGIGAHALPLLTAAADRVIIGARSITDSEASVLPLDLASLTSVRTFADGVRDALDGVGVDVLILNAGAQFPNTDEVTIDGFERHFAVNHLAHFLLVTSLLPVMNFGSRVILTTSDTHDPALFPWGPAELDVPGWAVAGAGLSTMEAYAAAKLGNLLTARHLTALPEAGERSISAFAYNPGLTGDTGLQREIPEARERVRAMQLQQQESVPDVPHLRMGTPERAGKVLARLALSQLEIPAGADYVSLLGGKIDYPEGSDLARRGGIAEQLWVASETLLAEH